MIILTICYSLLKSIQFSVSDFHRRHRSLQLRAWLQNKSLSSAPDECNYSEVALLQLKETCKTGTLYNQNAINTYETLCKHIHNVTKGHAY